MFPDTGTRATHDRLARLLSGADGSEILSTLTSRDLHARVQPDGVPTAVGLWTIHGGALIRNESPDFDPFDWSAAGDVPAAPPGTRRVVLVGESAARGWPYDPAFNCAQVLERQLNEGDAHPHQVVDLAKIRASAANLLEIIDVVPALAPDVVIAFIGNNVVVPPEEVELRSAVMDDPDVVTRLAESVRQKGYDGLRDELAAVARQRFQVLLDRLTGLADHGCTVVLVVPEFNLVSWVPEPGVETPLLPGPALISWYALADRAEAAAAVGDWPEVLAVARTMTEIDHRTSPISSYLMGTAALRLGDGKGARDALEMSRDAVSGLMVSCTPRITRELQDLMVDVADERGWPCVDLREVLADPAFAGLPGPQWFHDYCHLSDIGIERSMAAVADAVAGHSPGTAAAGPGVPASAQAFAQAHAGIHLAYTNQPLPVVTSRLTAAVDGDPDLAGPLAAIRDLLSGPTPRWTNPAASRLLDFPAAGSFLMSLVQTDGLPAGLWTLREALGEVVGAELTADEDDADLLIGPHCGGQSLPNFVPSRCHHQATARRSSLCFGLGSPRAVSLELTYRMRWAHRARRRSSASAVAPSVRFRPRRTGRTRPWKCRRPTFAPESIGSSSAGRFRSRMSASGTATTRPLWRAVSSPSFCPCSVNCSPRASITGEKDQMAEPIHDFTSKLHDRAVLPAVLDAIASQAAGEPAGIGPISINLDLTRSCNYGCDHCIDASILNQGKPFDTQLVKDSLDVLSRAGLRTVIFIGGGEPTLHPAFTDAVAHAKHLDLAVGIVSNGSRNRLLREIAPRLGGVDWIRLSLDAGTDRSFQLMHRPRRPIRLEEICAGVPGIAEANPAVSVGFSFIISWVDPLRIDGGFQHDNVDEIEAATVLAKDSGFSYISFKPLLHRDPGGNESIRFPAGSRGIQVRDRIRSQLAAAQELATQDFAVLGSVNLAAIEQEGALRAQPHRCYMHLFRQVLTPQGLYGCPAYRGDARDRLGDGDSYATDAALTATKDRTLMHLESFDPSIECRTIACLYSSANLWLDRIAKGETPPHRPTPGISSSEARVLRGTAELAQTGRARMSHRPAARAIVPSGRSALRTEADALTGQGREGRPVRHGRGSARCRPVLPRRPRVRPDRNARWHTPDRGDHAEVRRPPRPAVASRRR